MVSCDEALSFEYSNADVGWYQVRNVPQKRTAGGDYAPVDFKPLEVEYSALIENICLDVYTHSIAISDE